MLPNISGYSHLIDSLLALNSKKGRDNTATDAQSWVTLKLDTEIVKSILDGVIMGIIDRADAQVPAVA